MITIETKLEWNRASDSEWYLEIQNTGLGLTCDERGPTFFASCRYNSSTKKWIAFSYALNKVHHEFASAEEGKAWIERWLKRHCKRNKLRITKDGCVCFEPKVKNQTTM